MSLIYIYIYYTFIYSATYAFTLFFSKILCMNLFAIFLCVYVPIHLCTQFVLYSLKYCCIYLLNYWFIYLINDGWMKWRRWWNIYWMRGDGCMDGWMDGRIDWRELLQCIQKHGFASACELNSPMLAVFLFQRVPELNLEPCRRALSGAVNGSGNCSQDSAVNNISSLLILWVFQVPPSCFSLKGSPIITSWPNLVQELLQAYPSKHGTGNASCVSWIPIIGAMAVKTPGVHLGLLID